MWKQRTETNHAVSCGSREIKHMTKHDRFGSEAEFKPINIGLKITK